MKKILITGSLGFIGSNFIRQVIDQYPEYQWVGIDKAIYDYCLLNTFEHPNYKFYLADIANEHIIDRIFSIEKPNIIINFAAESFVCSSIENANPFIYSNIMGTQTLINASVKYEVEKFFQISTDEVYGSHTSKNDPPWTELSLTRPRNPYSSSKMGAENILYAANQTHGLQFNITRCCNVYGPRQPTNRNLIPKAIKQTINNQMMPIYGDGSHMREYIYVDDKINAIMTILHKGKINQIYNIGSDIEFSNTEIVSLIAEKLNKEPKINYTTNRKAHDFRYFLNCDKLKELGWKTENNFDINIQKTIQWYEKNKFDR